MTRDQDWPLFVTCLTKLSANYHDAMMTTEEGIQIKAETYWEALEDLKPVQLEWAVKTMIRNRGGFFPTVHEIRELASIAYTLASIILHQGVAVLGLTYSRRNTS